jgi:hypothetical protein
MGEKASQVLKRRSSQSGAAADNFFGAGSAPAQRQGSAAALATPFSAATHTAATSARLILPLVRSPCGGSREG